MTVDASEEHIQNADSIMINVYLYTRRGRYAHSKLYPPPNPAFSSHHTIK